MPADRPERPNRNNNRQNRRPGDGYGRPNRAENGQRPDRPGHPDRSNFQGGRPPFPPRPDHSDGRDNQDLRNRPDRQDRPGGYDRSERPSHFQRQERPERGGFNPGRANGPRRDPQGPGGSRFEGPSADRRPGASGRQGREFSGPGRPSPQWRDSRNDRTARPSEAQGERPRPGHRNERPDNPRPPRQAKERPHPVSDRAERGNSGADNKAGVEQPIKNTVKAAGHLIELPILPGSEGVPEPDIDSMTYIAYGEQGDDVAFELTDDLEEALEIMQQMRDDGFAVKLFQAQELEIVQAD